MTNPLFRGDEPSSPGQSSRPNSSEPTPLLTAVRRHRRGYEIEDATLVEMAALLDGLTRKYRSEIEQRIQDRRLLQSSMQVSELHHAYLRQEVDVVGDHIGKLFTLHRQASRELRVFRRWIKKLYPGWSRVFDEANRRAAGDNSKRK